MKSYVEPKVEIVRIDSKDIITTSNYVCDGTETQPSCAIGFNG